MATDISFWQARKTAVENQIAGFQSGIEQGGRGDKLVKFRGSTDLYNELRYINRQISLASGTAITRVQMRHGDGY